MRSTDTVHSSIRRITQKPKPGGMTLARDDLGTHQPAAPLGPGPSSRSSRQSGHDQPLPQAAALSCPSCLPRPGLGVSFLPRLALLASPRCLRMMAPARPSAGSPQDTGLVPTSFLALLTSPLSGKTSDLIHASLRPGLSDFTARLLQDTRRGSVFVSCPSLRRKGSPMRAGTPPLRSQLQPDCPTHKKLLKNIC